MNILFMGTPAFALPSLQRLVADGHRVAGVFTQPDKPKGRGYQLAAPPVKELAQELNIPVYQPAGLKDGQALEIAAGLTPDVIVVVAYGRILPQTFLDLPRWGCINVHASLLPRLRGAAPIQWSILRGDTVTGITTMQMAAGLDTGDMLLRRETPIDPEETSLALHDRLSVIGAELLSETLIQLERGELIPEKQDDALATYAPMLTKEQCVIDWTKDAREIHNLIRGVAPFLTASASMEGKRLKIVRARLTDIRAELPPGSVLPDAGHLLVTCGEGGVIELLEVQMEGKKRLLAKEFLRGHKLSTLHS